MARYILAATAAIFLSFSVLGQWAVGQADEAPSTEQPVAATAPEQPAGLDSASPEDAPPKPALSKDPPGMIRLLPDKDLWIDMKNKRVVMDGVVCLREGQLEMFACIKGTKEHESIIAVDTLAYAVHAALVRIGAKPGTPVQFQPEYRPASGTEIDITLVWTDENGKTRRARAQDWVRNIKTGKEMEHKWVFAGSGFTQGDDGVPYYRAQGGDFICVSNFPSAMLDLPVESSGANEALLFSPFTERIPPRGTKVRLVLTPRLEESTSGEAEQQPAALEGKQDGSGTDNQK